MPTDPPPVIARLIRTVRRAGVGHAARSLRPRRRRKADVDVVAVRLGRDSREQRNASGAAALRRGALAPVFRSGGRAAKFHEDRARHRTSVARLFRRRRRIGAASTVGRPAMPSRPAITFCSSLPAKLPDKNATRFRLLRVCNVDRHLEPPALASCRSFVPRRRAYSGYGG